MKKWVSDKKNHQEEFSPFDCVAKIPVLFYINKFSLNLKLSNKKTVTLITFDFN